MDIKSISILWNNSDKDFNLLTNKLCKSILFLQENYQNTFTTLYELGYSNKTSVNDIILINRENIKSLILNNQIGNNLGYSISLWNGNKNESLSASFSSRIGIAVTNKLKNNFIINFPNTNNISKLEINNIINFIFNLWNADEIRVNGKIIEINKIITGSESPPFSLLD